MARLGGSPGRPLPTPRTVSYANLPALAGESFVSEPFTIDRDESADFERLMYFIELEDHERSAEVVPDIVEGFHALSLIDPLFNEHLRFDRRECFVLNYGVDSVRFPSQLVNARELVFQMMVADVIDRGAGRVVLTNFQIGHLNADKPGAAGVSRLYVGPRETAEEKP